MGQCHDLQGESKKGDLEPKKPADTVTLTMNTQPHQIHSQNSQLYPQITKPHYAVDNVKPRRQVWGTVLSIIIILVVLCVAFYEFMGFYEGEIPALIAGLDILGDLSLITFQVLALTKPYYLAGTPSSMALAPALAAPVIFFLADICYIFFNPALFIVLLTFNFFLHTITLATLYFMYAADDNSGSCCLCAKPWICKRPVTIFAQEYPQYLPPPQPANYPQEYPPQQPSFPAQGYPPASKV